MEALVKVALSIQPQLVEVSCTSIVVFGKHFRGSTFGVKVHGGGTGGQYADAKPQGCGNGGAGTVYMAHEDMLRIDNDGIITNKFTRLYGQRQN